MNQFADKSRSDAQKRDPEGGILSIGKRLHLEDWWRITVLACEATKTYYFVYECLHHGTYYRWFCGSLES